MARELTDKQQLFVNEYCVDRNATAAVIRAGYSKKNADSWGSQMLSKPKVRKAIDLRLSEISEKTLVTSEYVITGLREIADKCRTKDLWNPQAVNQAFKLLGEHLQLYTKNFNHGGELKVSPLIINIKEPE